MFTQNLTIKKVAEEIERDVPSSHESLKTNETFVLKVSDITSAPNMLLKVCFERGWRIHIGNVPPNHLSVVHPYGSAMNHPNASCHVSADSIVPSYTAPDGRVYTAGDVEHWNLWWRLGAPNSAYNKQLKPWQFTNHIPRGSQLCRKDNLARFIKCMKKVYGAIYDFTPEGYSLPLEYLKLAAECTKVESVVCPEIHEAKEVLKTHEEQPVWICKPVGRSQGKGIFLFRHISELTYDSSAIVQRYIQNPLLIGGYKFDLRLYVCVPSYRPPVVYLYREGLARFSTDKFSLNDLDNPFRHLTNSSINKLGPRYAEWKERVGLGCKWSLRQLRLYLRQNGIRDWLLWQRISCLVALTVLAQATAVPPCANCFEFFGFDVLVDADLRPWLLEVNISPGLGTDCDVDSAVKKPLLHDMFDLLGLPVCPTGIQALFQGPQYTASDCTSSVSKSSSVAPSQNSQSVSTSSSSSTLWSPKDMKYLHSNRCKRKRQPPKELPEKVLNSVNRLTKDLQKGPSLPEYATIRNAAKNTNKPTQSQSSTSSSTNYDTCWWNGKNWEEPLAQEGDWTRIYPLDFDEESKEGKREPPQSKTPPGPNLQNEICSGESRLHVRAVARFLNAARFIYRSLPKNSTDDELNEALRGHMELISYPWLPPKPMKKSQNEAKK